MNNSEIKFKESKLKTLSFLVDENIYDAIVKDSVSLQISMSEAVRRRLIEAYLSTEKQEEKIVKRFEEFEKTVHKLIDEKNEKLTNHMTRNLSYTLTNHHLIKMIIRDVIHKGLEPDKQVELSKQYLSIAKALGLKIHPVDSLYSKENITSNVLPEHLK